MTRVVLYCVTNVAILYHYFLAICNDKGFVLCEKVCNIVDLLILKEKSDNHSYSC